MLTLAKKQDFYGFTFTGRTFDCGSKTGFIKANVAFAMWNSEMADEVREDILELIETVKPV